MAFIKDIINQFDDSSELAQTQRELIQTLGSMAKAKAEIFRAEIQDSIINAGGSGNLTIPVEAIIRTSIQTRAFASEDTQQITQAVTSIIKSFVKGGDESVIEGVSGLIGILLDTFLGKASAETGETHEYYVLTRSLSIVRLDIKAWYQNVSAQSIRQKMERVCCFVGVLSAIDLSRLGFSSFLAIYENQLGETDMTPDEIKQALKLARDIYDDYVQANPAVKAEDKVVIQTPPALIHLSGALQKPPELRPQ